ncbi:class I fructose-bisphosphate aldolase [Pseudonocardia parietis]|uniref:fructose-bisphosphate aldolase n=1 Tax=Pseudonocardia parietis TaxID=570936 RepID=A0ABS4W392_9PSEU|nr:class I fructose-bisphosphate aldolase [Pseudonocardia parietis]MBP2370418.1 fructose-bisphosphate aldolase class I [Pseudonocardia parietis]
MDPIEQDSAPATAKALVGHPRGIVALDGGAFGPAYRDDAALQQLVATTPDLDEYVNGVVLPAASLHRRADDGRSLARILSDHGLLPGARVDTGELPLAGSPGESVIGGTDGLTERMTGLARAGIRFVTCRSRTVVGADAPSVWAVRSNANVLARYARTAQDVGLVPLLHCGVAPDGTHSAERGAQALATALTRVLAELDDAGVDLRAVVLSPGVALPGRLSRQSIAPADVARLTVEILRLVVPVDVAGLAVHAAGSDLDVAVAVLALAQDPTLPWPLTFCFGRTLTAPAIRVWRGHLWLTYLGQVELARGVERACAVLRPPRPRLRVARPHDTTRLTR